MNKIIEKINYLFNLQIYTFEKINKGFLSENYILSSNKEKYFLKRYRFDNQERIEEVHLAKKYFFDGGIPIILPLINKEGSSFFFVDGGYFALFPYISDKQLEKSDFTDTEIISLGETLGKIHLLGQRSKLPIKERFKPWNREKSLEKIEAIHTKINTLAELNDFDRLALKSIELKKKLIMENSIVYEQLNLPSNHLIHGDYLGHNVFFGANNNVSYVFDFEKTDYSPRMYELFRSLVYTFLSEDISDVNLEKAKLYLNSYLSVYPASKTELTNGLKLFYLKSIHGLWVEGEHYLNNNNRTDVLLVNDTIRIKYLAENYEGFEEKLFKH